MKLIGTCKQCLWWMEWRDGTHYCANDRKIGDSARNDSDCAHLKSHDDAAFFTGADFGCVHWTDKTP